MVGNKKVLSKKEVETKAQEALYTGLKRSGEESKRAQRERGRKQTIQSTASKSQAVSGKATEDYRRKMEEAKTRGISTMQYDPKIIAFDMFARNQLWGTMMKGVIHKEFPITLALTTMIKGKIAEVGHTVCNAFSSPDVVIPAITHRVELSAPGKLPKLELQFSNMDPKNEASKEAMDQLNLLFDADVKNWLRGRGYEIDKSTQDVYKQDASGNKVLLIPKEFARMRDGHDGQQSLNDYIEAQFQLGVEQDHTLGSPKP